MIKIVNLRDTGLRSSYGSFVRVDRHHSPLGNPFYMGSEDDRERVIEEYRRWLWAQIQLKGQVYEELQRLLVIWQLTGHLILACWCAPKRCHAHIIRRALLWMHGGQPQ